MTAVTSRGRRRLHRERERLEAEAEESGEINLVPYLDIVTNILMFLLLSVTAAVVLGNIETISPSITRGGSAAAEPQTDKPNLDLTVAITGKGFTVAGSAGTIGVLYENDVPGKLPTVPKLSGDRYDFDKLQKVLVKVKKTKRPPPYQNETYDDEEKVALTANPDIRYENVIGTMDVLRLGPDKKPLFPKVQFSAGIQ